MELIHTNYKSTLSKLIEFDHDKYLHIIHIIHVYVSTNIKVNMLRLKLHYIQF